MKDKLGSPLVYTEILGRRWPPQVKTNICVSYRRRQDEEGAALSGRVTSENIEGDISPSLWLWLDCAVHFKLADALLPWFESTFLCSLYANKTGQLPTPRHTHTVALLYVILCKAYIAVSLCVSPSNLSLSVFICKIHRQRESTWTSLNQHGYFSLIFEVRLHREKKFQIGPTCYVATEVMMTSKV